MIVFIIFLIIENYFNSNDYIDFMNTKVKTVHFFLPEDVYFQLIELKGKLRAENWSEFMEKVIDIVNQKMEEDKR